MSNNRDLELALRLRADVRDALAEMKRAEREVDDLGKKGEQAGKRMAGLSSAFSSLRNLLIGVGLAAGTRAFVQQADSAANLAGRLRLVTNSQAEFADAMRDTYAVAQRSSAQWGSISGLYASLAQTTSLAHREVVALADAVSKAFVISQASPEDTANGIRQLQQAIAGGVVRAEEFNSVVDTAPRIVQALADHFGIAFGEVREYINAGKVSSQDLINALLEAAPAMDKEFAKLPLTVQRAMQQVDNALLQLIGGADGATGASAGLARGIQDLARTLESPEVSRGLTTFLGGVVGLTGATATAISKIAEFTRTTAEAFAERAVGSTDPVERIYEQIRTLETQRENRQKQLLTQSSDGAFGFIERTLGTPPDKLIADIKSINAQIDELKKKADTLSDIRPAAPAAPGQKPAEKPKLLDTKTNDEEQKKAAESARDSLLKLSAQLGDQVGTFGAGEQAALQYRLTLGSLADEVKRLGPEGAKLREQILAQAGALDRLQDAAKKEAEVQRQREQAADEAARKAREIEQEGVSLKLSLRTAQEQYNDEIERYGQLLKAGAIDQETFNRAVDASKDRLKKAAEQANDSNKMMENFAESAAQNIQSAFADFLFDPFDGGIKGMVSSFADALRRMAAEALASQILGNFTKPGADGKTSVLGSLFASVLHSGGDAGRPGGATRAVSPLLFVGAERFHDARLPDLKSNELPAIITRDEAVLTANQQDSINKRLANSGSAGGAVAIEIGMTEGLFAQMIDGPAGSRALLRFARRNRAAFKEALG